MKSLDFSLEIPFFLTLDVFPCFCSVVPRKIGMPGHDEYAIGALTEDGDIYLNRGQMQQLKLTDTDLQDTIRDEMKEAQRRLKTYRGDLPERNWQGKRVIVADDGIATVRLVLS